MSDKNYLKILYLAALMSWLGSAYMFFFKSPANGKFTVAFFLTSLAVSFFLTFTFVSAALAKKLSSLPRPIEPGPALRRGLLLTILTIGLLALSMYHLLNLFDGAALLITLILAESFFHARYKRIPIDAGSEPTQN